MTAENRSDFLRHLESHIVVCDGAMGSMLYRRGIYINQCYDNINVVRPHLVKSIHQEYIQAGAQVIETNTFGANHYKLANYGLADKTREINLAGARLAREAAQDKVWVAGAVGPIHSQQAGSGQGLAPQERREVFREQIAALLEGEVDLLMLETFSDMDELADAILAAREVAADLPLVAQVVFGQSQTTRYDLTPEQVAKQLDALPVDVIGGQLRHGPGGADGGGRPARPGYAKADLHPAQRRRTYRP